MEVGSRWDAKPTAVVASFRKPVANRYSARHLGRQIVLEGTETSRVVEGEESYTSSTLEGVIPGSIDPGVYACEYVHLYVPDRG